MSARVYIDFKCPECGEKYLPFNEEQKACPKCGNIACAIITPIAKIVSMAKENMDSPDFVPDTLPDTYILNAVKILRAVGYPDVVISDKNEADRVASDIARKMDFANSKYQKKHAAAFVAAVIKETFLPAS